MSKYLNKSSSPTRTVKREPTYDSRRKRIEEEQAIHPVTLEMEATSEIRQFEDTISGLYGIYGIGKTRFAYDLGEVLREKYNLPESGVYFLQCEPVNHPLQIRKSHISTWPTFRKFIDDAEKNSEFISSVKMFVIDCADSLVPRGISTICYDMGVVDLKDATVRVGENGWNAVAWQELRHELLHQILRLHALGPGVLVLGHERYREVSNGRMTFSRPSMDLSTSVLNAIGQACSMIMRIRGSGEEQTEFNQAQTRCLSCIGSDLEDAKDNLNKVLNHYPNGQIPFTTEREAVEKLFACFDNEPKVVVPKKKIATKIKIKKG